jgi:hypothetical protein
MGKARFPISSFNSEEGRAETATIITYPERGVLSSEKMGA